MSYTIKQIKNELYKDCTSLNKINLNEIKKESLIEYYELLNFINLLERNDKDISQYYKPNGRYTPFDILYLNLEKRCIDLFELKNRNKIYEEVFLEESKYNSLKEIPFTIDNKITDIKVNTYYINFNSCELASEGFLIKLSNNKKIPTYKNKTVLTEKTTHFSNKTKVNKNFILIPKSDFHKYILF
jgi:hypothetical protein